LAAALARVPGVRVLPDPPQVNMFHLHFAASPLAMAAARDALAEREGVWLGRFAPGATPDASYLELYVGDAVPPLPDAQIAAWFAGVVADAQARP
jgi:hypothetical protein